MKRLALTLAIIALPTLALADPAPAQDWQSLAKIYAAQRDQDAAQAQNAIAEAQVERGQIEAAQKVAKATADYWARYVGLKPAAKVELPSQGNHLGAMRPGHPSPMAMPSKIVPVPTATAPANAPSVTQSKPH